MNKSDCSLLKSTVVKLLLVGFLVIGVFLMPSGLVFAAESEGETEGEEVVEPGKVGRLEEMVEKMVKKHSLAGLGLSLYGYVDVSYIQNFKNPNSPGGGSNINQNRIFDTDSNSFTVHLAQVVLEKEGKAGGALEDAAGFRLKLNLKGTFDDLFGHENGRSHSQGKRQSIARPRIDGEFLIFILDMDKGKEGVILKLRNFNSLHLDVNHFKDVFNQIMGHRPGQLDALKLNGDGIGFQ